MLRTSQGERVEALRVENLSKNFEGLQALRGVTLGIKEGEHIGIIGPNGSGKTTLLNLISGELRPSSGKVYIFGQEVTHKPSHARVRLGLARTFQLNTLFFPLTVLDNALLPIQALKPFRYGAFRPLTSYQALFKEAEELLVRWGLWEKRNLPVQYLSYGEQRALELVVGLASNPKLILLDEPIAGLSASETATLTTMIQDFKHDISTVIVEHNIDALFKVAQYIVVLDHGEVIAQGTKEEVRADAKVRQVYLGAAEVDNAETDCHTYLLW